MLKILAGDFGTNKTGAVHTTLTGKFHSLTISQGLIKFVRVRPREIGSVEIVTDENKANIGGAFGGGVAGMLVAGPLGALAGAIIGGRGTAFTLVVKLCDGRQFLCVAGAKEYQHIAAAAMTNSAEAEKPQQRPRTPNPNPDEDADFEFLQNREGSSQDSVIPKPADDERFVIACGGCGQRLSVKKKHSGRITICINCDKKLTIPSP